MSCHLLEWAEIYSTEGEHVSGTSNVLAVDATVRFLSEEHLPFAIFAFLIFLLLLLPPLLLILYPCKVFSRCLNCCCRRRWHALNIFVEAATKMEFLKGGIFDPCLESICSYAMYSFL